MTPQEAADLVRSLETRAVEHTILLKYIYRWLMFIGGMLAFLTVVLLLK